MIKLNNIKLNQYPVEHKEVIIFSKDKNEYQYAVLEKNNNTYCWHSGIWREIIGESQARMKLFILEVNSFPYWIYVEDISNFLFPKMIGGEKIGNRSEILDV